MNPKRVPVTIGMVDDDESVRMALSSMLRSANWRVNAYASGSHLLADTRRLEIKLVVADIQMPEMDGFALLKSIQQWTHPIPVIFITAHEREGIAERAKACGAAGFFSKPVDDARLLSLIDEILGPAKRCR